MTLNTVNGWALVPGPAKLNPNKQGKTTMADAKTLKVYITRPCWVEYKQRAIGDALTLPYLQAKYLVGIGKASEKEEDAKEAKALKVERDKAHTDYRKKFVDEEAPEPPKK